jgi:hypothetical protein
MKHAFALFAFDVIFLFTSYQYIQLQRQTDGEIPRLKSLTALELTLILLNGLLIILFFTSGYQPKLMSSIKITIGILQFHKLYMMISVLSYFK